MSDGKQLAHLEETDAEAGRPHQEAELQPAVDGAGPLYQRDYLGVIVDSDVTPEAVIEMLRADFPSFSPPELAAFTREGDTDGPLDVGNDMTVRIRAAGEAGVRVMRIDDRSITLRTLEDHPEAGRISFGTYHDEQGRLTFRIRSRARAADTLRLVGWHLLGKRLQTEVWVKFIERVAEACGGRLAGGVETRIEKVEDSLADMGGLETPTFPAVDRGE